MLEEQRLHSAVHDCASFDCGVPSLNDYLAKFATQHRRRGISQTYVLVDPKTSSAVLGYYTLSAAQMLQAAVADMKMSRGRGTMQQPLR